MYVSPYIKELFDKNGWTNYSAAYMWGTMGYVYNPDYVDKEDLLSWAGNEIKEFMAQFDTETHKEIKELHVRINEPIYYTAKSIHSAAETRLELDLNAIDSLSSRMDRTASKAARLESLLDSLRWKLQYQEVETEDEKKISLAEKYNVSSGALSVNQAGILRAGAGRLTDAAAALRAMDGRLLR